MVEAFQPGREGRPMVRVIREIPKLLGKLFLSVTFVTRAIGDTVHDIEEMSPFLAPMNIPEPQLRLTGAILLLFVGSLSMLAVGYVVDSTRADDQAAPPATENISF
jgi:hypothetical protein